MRFTSKIFYITTLFLIIVSCVDFSTDLEVENLNHPNDKILASDPAALEATAATIIHNWYMSIHDFNTIGGSLATMADISTCSFGNLGMRDMSSEPRVAFNNTSSYMYDGITRDYFNAFYAILSDSNAIIFAIENNIDFKDPAQMEMIGRLGQALSIGYLALIFDKVWLSDENGSIGDDAVDYKEAMTFALEKLDEAIRIAQANDVSIPDAWLPGGAGNSTTLLQFMNSLGARMLVNNVRNSSQKAQIDWDRVLNYTNSGLAIDFEIYMDDVIWYNATPLFYLVYPGWGRVDMRIIHLMDPNTTDYWEDSMITLPPSNSPDARLLSDYQYLSSNNFEPARGKYHFSSYRYSRNDDYITTWTMNVIEFSRSENDMYKAEAMALLGNLSGAADVINAGTRTTRGQLPNVAADIDEVKSAIFYERMVEFSYTSMGIGFFEMRKEDLLQKGTLLHFPIPGKALEAIPAPNYTYGGTDGVAGEDYSNGGWR
jgi:hypothetical protein